MDFSEFEEYLHMNNIPLPVGLDGSQVLEELTSLFTRADQVESLSTFINNDALTLFFVNCGNIISW